MTAQEQFMGAPPTITYWPGGHSYQQADGVAAKLMRAIIEYEKAVAHDEETLKG